MLKRVWWTMVFLAAAVAARADFAMDLARIHIESLGGLPAVKKFKSMRAEGVTRVGEQELSFVMWAARPNLIRTEVTDGERVSVQAYDGKGEPWTLDSRIGKVLRIGGAMGEEFKSDSEFDDPLVQALFKGEVSLDYAGTETLEGKEVFKVLVVQRLVDTSFIYVDSETYLIVRRETVARRGKKSARKVTDLADYREVAGVMMPHRLMMRGEKGILHETILKKIEANTPAPKDGYGEPVVK